MGEYFIGDRGSVLGTRDRVKAAREFRAEIERHITEHIPELRRFMVKAWNESGKYQSVLKAYKTRRLPFVNEKEREEFLSFCKERVWQCPFNTSNAEYPDETKELIQIVDDDMNGMPWEHGMCGGQSFTIGEGGDRIEYSDNGWGVLGSWGVDYGRVPGLPEVHRSHRAGLAYRRLELPLDSKRPPDRQVHVLDKSARPLSRGSRPGGTLFRAVFCV